jgi:hypothetical protein
MSAGPKPPFTPGDELVGVVEELDPAEVVSLVFPT